MGKLFEELKRRKVFRVAAAYAVVSWVLLQVAETVLPALQMPQWTVSFVTVLFILGFLPTLIAAWAYEVTPDGIKTDAVATQMPAAAPNSVHPVNYVILAIVLLVAGIQVADRFLLDSETTVTTNSNTSQESAGDSRVTRGMIHLGAMNRRPLEAMLTNFDFTPDGDRLVYSSFENGVSKIMVRSLDSLTSEILFESTNNAAFSPVVSPDGDELVFINADSNLYRLSISDAGSPTLIDSRQFGHAGYGWLDSNRIIASGVTGDGFYSISINPPSDELLFSVEQDGAVRLRNPQTIPDSEYLLYNLVNSQEQTLVELVDLSNFNRRELLVNASAARYVESGHLVFMRDSDLWAVPFDRSSMNITGEERRVIEGVENYSSQTFAVYAVSARGDLVYLTGMDQEEQREVSELALVDNSGQFSKLPMQNQRYSDFSISPDGTRLALVVNEPGDGSDVWVYHLERQTLSRVTYSLSSANPIWTRDSEELIYEDFSNNTIWRIRANGAGLAEHLYTGSGTGRNPTRAVSPDGQSLIFQRNVNGSTNISMLSLASTEQAPVTLLGSEAAENNPRVSPNGNWLAYQSNESGRSEVYVRPFPNVMDDKIQVSINGGSEPQWGADGVLLFYIDEQNSTVVSVPVSSESGFDFGEVITRAPIPGTRTNPPTYSTFPGSDTVLVPLLTEGQQNGFQQPQQVYAVLVRNWLEELKRLVPASQN